MARGNAEFAKVNPDPTVFREVASRALRLSPRDPQAYLFHNLLGAARLVENCWEFDEESANAFATASRYQNASEAVVVNAAFASVQVGRNDDAVFYMNPIGHGDPKGESGKLFTDLSTLTTVKEILNSVKIEINR